MKKKKNAEKRRENLHARFAVCREGRICERGASSRKERISAACFDPPRFLRTLAVLQLSKFGRRARDARARGNANARARARMHSRERARAQSRASAPACARARTHSRAHARASARAVADANARAAGRTYAPINLPAERSLSACGAPAVAAGDAFPRQAQGGCPGWLTGAQRHQWSSGRIHCCHRCDPGSIPG